MSFRQGILNIRTQKGVNRVSEKRKDNKGRILKDGESQRSDGRYMYQYTDTYGKRKTIYSWRLVETDRTPKGKKDSPSLREQEEKVNRDEMDGIKAGMDKMTLNEMFEIYFSTKRALKESTKTNYRYMWDKYAKDTIGRKKLYTVKKSDILHYYHDLLDLGFKPNSMEVMHTILHPTLQMAVEDGYIRLNPTAGCMAEIKKSHDWEKPKRHALTIEQQKAFIEYTRNSTTYNHWLPLFTLLLGTGCRIGEALALRWDDVNFKTGVISINHNLIYRVQDTGECQFKITTPKTRNSIREIPLLDDVRKALLEERKKQFQFGVIRSVEVDGYTNFIFTNRFGNVYNPMTINRAIKRIYTAYNVEETEKAKKEKRKPVLIPHFSCHHLRHTFCTRFCENESNLKVIQEIMGHSDISTTMDVYAEATQEKKKEAFKNLEGKIKIS